MSGNLEGSFGMSVVGIIGAGKRYVNYYKPVIDAMGLEVSGFVTKTGKISDNVGDYSCYRNIKELCEETHPDFLIAVVPYYETPNILMQACDVECDVLVETPVGRYSQMQPIIQKIYQSQILAGVVEQWCFFPLEQFKKMIIDSGVIGRVLFAENDYRTYNYHGMAQLRNYIGKDANVSNVVGRMRKNYPLNGKDDFWNISLAHFDNDSTLLFKYSDLMGKCDELRGVRNLRIYGETGSVIAGCRTEDGVESFSVLDSDGNVCFLDVDVVEDRDTVISITSKLPSGEIISWENPYSKFSFNDDQIGIASHIQGMIDGKLLWSVEDGFKDMQLGDESWC